MNGSARPSPWFDPGFTTAAMAEAFSPRSTVDAMCRVEAALASASADAGVLDRSTADEIASACAEGVDDPAGLLTAGWEAGTPVLPLLEALRTRPSDEARQWLHHGATTQDVVDTGRMLQASTGIGLLRAGLAELGGRLRTLAVAHRDTPATGWTFLQPATDTTVGLRVAGWLAPAVAHAHALGEARDRLPLQLGGPTGTLDVLGEHGPAVQDAMARSLGLVVPPLPWHTDRSRVAELMALLERVARTMAKVGTDLALLAHDDVAHMRAGGSSSMPGKRNPIDAVRAIAAAEACSGAASVVTRGRSHELERGVGGWHAEAWAVPASFQACAATVEAIGRAVETLGFVADETSGPGTAAGRLVDRAVAACDAEFGTAP